jgi:hypothetical protein
MFPKSNTYVDGEISRTVIALQRATIDSEEYGTLLGRLEKLQKIRQEEKPDAVSTDVLVMAATNLIGIIAILQYENLNVVTSKALSFVTRTRL